MHYDIVYTNDGFYCKIHCTEVGLKALCIFKATNTNCVSQSNNIIHNCIFTEMHVLLHILLLEV